MTVALADDDTRSVGFIWVDVVCIDRRFNTESMLEILLIKETRLLESKGDSYVVPENFQPSMLKLLGIDHGRKAFYSLAVVIGEFEDLRLYLERLSRMRTTRLTAFDRACDETLDLLNRTGFTALSFHSPMELYPAAVYRQPSNKLDSIYGIMQVFGFRLGQSDPSAQPGYKPTLPELEDQLGIALMELCPTLSQCFRQVVVPRATGKNWRVGPLSAMPGYSLTAAMDWEPELYQTECVLSTECIGDVIWGRFQGKVCSFATLRTAWPRAPIHGEAVTGDDPGSYSYISVIVDYAPDMFPGWPNASDYESRQGASQYRVADQLADQFSEEKLKVLHLGFIDTSELSESHYGLVLLQENEGNMTYWRRLGICTWDALKRKKERVEAVVDLLGKIGLGGRLSGTGSIYHGLVPKYDCNTMQHVQKHWADLTVTTTHGRILARMNDGAQLVGVTDDEIDAHGGAEG
ncbi:hypothetical protein BGZ61DRAFT_521339 [Ilyonectria robusta]|uniref:uncharacterized protein n=1 Tax=Ilyonectria robusta TaxID=1079257 RepID=UPI001E8D7C27|nr:uncharacterized protein BGZ61DRAFT_521339 [Ilyonectria robusta]KAH8672324.1 hypothetical protein BGZ61DRAFT_521339 [Ilyonectria robusta]